MVLSMWSNLRLPAISRAAVIPSCLVSGDVIGTLPSHVLFLGVIRGITVSAVNDNNNLLASCGVIFSRMTVNRFCFVGRNTQPLVNLFK